jgi:hypothetical protein
MSCTTTCLTGRCDGPCGDMERHLGASRPNPDWCDHCQTDLKIPDPGYDGAYLCPCDLDEDQWPEGYTLPPSSPLAQERS